MSLSSLDRFTLHMATVPIVSLSIISAFMVSVACQSKQIKSNKTSPKKLLNPIYQVRKEATGKAIILFILVMYPSLATRIFSVLRCIEFNGIEGALLQQDFAIQCYVGKHATYLSLAIGFLCLYVAGVPIVIFLLLWRNRKHLHNLESPKHLEVKFELGGLYQQYEPKYWWYELVEILKKMLMTGALCVVTPGSPLQLVTAIIIMTVSMVMVLKMAPYSNSTDDWMSFLSNCALVVTTFGGLLIIMDGAEKGKNNFDSLLIGLILLWVNGTVLVLDCLLSCQSFSFTQKITSTIAKSKTFKRIRSIGSSLENVPNVSTGTIQSSSKGSSKKKTFTKVTPILETVQTVQTVQNVDESNLKRLKSKRKARDWLKKSASQGDKDAINALKRLDEIEGKTTTTSSTVNSNATFWKGEDEGEGGDSLFKKIEKQEKRENVPVALEEGTRNVQDQALYQQYGKRGKGLIKKSTILL